MRHDTTGRRLLQRVLQLHTATAVGRVCRVTQPAVTQWAYGITRPGERARAVPGREFDPREGLRAFR